MCLLDAWKKSKTYFPKKWFDGQAIAVCGKKITPP